MAQYSTAIRNARLDVIEATIGQNAVLKVFDGAMPANPAAADVGTVIATLQLPADWMQDAANGVKAKSGTWEDTSADAAGYAKYFRIYNSAGTVCGIQGLASQPWAATTAYVVGQQVHNGGNVYRATAAGNSGNAGGPTGTGNGITDGGVTWNYVGPLDMAFDNTNFALGQAVSVASYQITAGNA